MIYIIDNNYVKTTRLRRSIENAVDLDDKEPIERLKISMWLQSWSTTEMINALMDIEKNANNNQPDLLELLEN